MGSQLRTQLTKQPPQNSSKENFFVRVGSEGFQVRLRRLSEYGSVAYLVERPTRETRAEQYSDTILKMIICPFFLGVGGGVVNQFRMVTVTTTCLSLAEFNSIDSPELIGICISECQGELLLQKLHLHLHNLLGSSMAIICADSTGNSECQCVWCD